MTGKTRNLSEIAHRCRLAMAFGRKVELQLATGARVVGFVERITEDRDRKADCLAARPNARSHLLVVINGLETSVEQIRKVESAL